MMWIGDTCYLDGMETIPTPANGHVVWPNGHQVWFRNNKVHRDDGPAVIHTTGTDMWYRNGRKHRADGPSIINANGSKCWHKNGVRQCVITKFGVIWENGATECWENGRLIKKEDH